MGQAVSNTVNSSLEKIFPAHNRNAVSRELILFRERASFYADIALLTRNKFLDAVKEQNSILKLSYSHSQPYIAFGTIFKDTKFGWKAGTRVYCFLVNSDDGTILVTKRMNIVQFWALRNEILKQVEAKNVKEQFGEFQIVNENAIIDENNQCNESVTDNGQHNSFPVSTLSTAAILDRIEILNSEELECCICMARKSNISLQCAHCFCKECIETWSASRNEDQRTCPICRDKINSENEFWELTDIPDNEEMNSYLRKMVTEFETQLI